MNSIKSGFPKPVSRLLPLLALALLASFLSAQQIPDTELNLAWRPYAPVPSLRIQKNLILVNAVVRDSKGRTVGNLSSADFKVYDNGKLQVVSEFVVENAGPKSVNRHTPSQTIQQPSPPRVAGTSPVQPRFIALFFDDRNTPFSDLLLARQAAEQFVRNDLRPGDNVGVFAASDSPALAFTESTEKVLQAIKSIHVQMLGPPDYPHPCTQYPLGPFAASLILDKGDTETRAMYQCGDDSPSAEAELDVHARAVLFATETVSKISLTRIDSTITKLAQLPGQRIIVLTSSGFFTKTVESQIDQIVGDALRADVVINSLDAVGLSAIAPGGDAKDSPIYSRGVAASRASAPPTPFSAGSNGSPSRATNPDLSPSGVPASEYEKLILQEERDERDDVMADLARDTGGIFFHNNNDLDLGLREMAEVPEVSYRLGFSPVNLKPDGKFHDLKVKLAVSGSFEVQARRGYFAPTEAAAKAEGQASAFNDEVLKTDELNALPAQVGAQAGRLPAGGTGFQVSLRVDPKALSFQKDHGKHLDKLNLITALFTTDGKFVAGEAGIVNMALSNKSLDDLNQRGINATIVLPAAEGHYRLRVVMEDAASGKLFATSRTATIP